MQDPENPSPEELIAASSSHQEHDLINDETYNPEGENALELHHETQEELNYYGDNPEEEASISEQRNTEKSTKNRTYNFITRSKGQSYTCEVCKKMFRYRSKYVEHLRVHSGERPFACSFCPQSFTQRGALNQHERIHTGIKPHRCPYCSKSFRTASYLTIHIRNHETVTDESGTMAHFESVMSGEYFENGEYKFEDPEGEDFGETEIFQIYEEPEEASHQWRVSHIPQAVVNSPSQMESETELKLTRFSDGRLQVNDIVLEGESYPEDGITLYYYTLANNEVLTFLYDSVNQTLEIVEPNEGDVQANPEELEHIQHHYGEGHEGAYEIFEEVHSENMVARPSVTIQIPQNEEIHDRTVQDKNHKTQPSVEYITVSSEVAYVDQPMEALDNNNQEVILVDDGLVEAEFSQEPYVIPYTSEIRRKHRKPRNLEWIINAIASGKKLEEATPHKRKKPTTYYCEICDLDLKYPSKIAAHMRTHTGEKPFACEICNRRFAMNTTLRMHMRRHLNQKTFHCAFPGCNKSFVNGALLNHHIQTRHFVRRKFACLRGCGSTFLSNKGREKHEKTCGFQHFGTSTDAEGHFYDEFVNPNTGETQEWTYVNEEENFVEQ